MNDAVVIQNMANHSEAVRLCLANRLIVPALILIYTGIDFVASLARPATQSDVTKNDFIRWAERFMDCRQRLGVSGLDLYAARCGVVHTYTADSKLHRAGQAKRIFYSWGNQEPHEANSLVRRLGYSEVFIKIESLFDTFNHGLEKFGTAMTKDEQLTTLVVSRGGQLFSNYPQFPS